MSTNASAPQRLLTARGNLLENLTVRQKLNTLIAVMTLGFLSLFIISLRGSSTLNFHLSNIYNSMFVPVTTITQAETELADMQIQMEAMRNSELTIEEHAAHFESIEGSRQVVVATIEKYRAEWLTTNNPEFTKILRTKGELGLQQSEVQALDRLTLAFNDFIKAKDIFQAEFHKGNYNNELALAATGALNTSRNQLKQLEEINNQYAALSYEAAISNYQSNNLGLILTLLIAIIVGLISSNAIANSISARLIMVEKTALSFQDGYLDRRSVTTVQGTDEIASLAKTFNHLFNQVQGTFVDLEKRVDERTASLAIATEESEKRAKQFEAITLVGNAISSIRSLDDVLPKITELISQQFGYYHIGIFLNDENNEYAILSAANSEGGQRMLKRAHQLKIGEQGIVGNATSTGKPRIALDVGEDAVYFDNPDMPETRSEMALPLRINENIIGALDVQSTEEAAFSEDDISVLALLADQVSMAIENARLFDQARRSVSESEALYRQYIHQAWSRLPKEQNLAGYRYNARGSSPIEKISQSIMGIASKNDSAQAGTSRLSVPISIRGETIGALSVQVPDTKKLNENQLDMVNAVVERVALSVENARLFEETNRRAEREHLVSDITVKIRSTNDPDAMIQVALDELKNALGATNVQLVPHTIKKDNNAPAPLPEAKPSGKH